MQSRRRHLTAVVLGLLTIAWGAPQALGQSHPKLAASLEYLQRVGRPGPILPPAVLNAHRPTNTNEAIQSFFKFHPDGRVMVEVYSNGGQLPGAFAAVGGVPMGGADDCTVGRVATDRLTDLANQPGVRFVRPYPKPQPADRFTGQEVAWSNTARFHDLGIKGEGVTIFVWDLGFDGATALTGRELPTADKLEKIYFGEAAESTGMVHGTAVAEICHEMAPEANIVLVYADPVTPFDAQVDAILNHRAAVKVVNASFGLPSEPFDGRGGFVAAQIRRLRDAGVLLCAASGNSADAHVYARINPDSNGYHQFAPGDTTLDFVFNGSVAVYMDWDNYPAGRLHPRTDVDLAIEIVDDTGAVKATFDTIQNGNQPPQEQGQYDDATAAGKTYGLKVKLKDDGAMDITPNFNLLFSPSTTSGDEIVDKAYINRDHSSIVPAAVPGVISVGAVDINTDTLEDWSQRGPTPDGRQYPLLTGADQMFSVSYSGPFPGTSAASPHVCGGLALIRSQRPDLSADELAGNMLSYVTDPPDERGVLRRYNTVDRGPSGPDNMYGDGRLMMDPAPTAAGTKLTLSVVTANIAQGGLPSDVNNPIGVTYTSLDKQRRALLWDGNPITVYADSGTELAFDQLSSGTATTQRWYSPAPLVFTVPSTEQSYEAPYYHQLRRNFRARVQAGATPLDSANTVQLTLQSGGQPSTAAIEATPQALFADTGSTYTFAELSSASGSEERWASDGPITGTITTQTGEVIAQYYHQVRPQITLVGTNSSSTVKTTQRRVFGQSALLEGLYGTFMEFCDNRSQLAFSAESTGTPVLAAEGVREFTVEKGLQRSINYVIQPRRDTSTVSVSALKVPANGRTKVRVTVTIRDSAGAPVAGISPDRVDVFPTRAADARADEPAPTDGIRMTSPTSPTDSTGRLIFEVTRDIPGRVRFTAALDGQAIAEVTDGSDTVEFLQIMRVPLPIAGLYLLSFPITPENSHELIQEFSVTPTPPQMARLIDGTTNYEFFQPRSNNPAFTIQPGKGFFLKTNTPGSIELTGEWSRGTEYNLPLNTLGFHMLGNPQADRALLWRLADFEVFQAGQSRGLLSDQATWTLVDPVVWGYNGRDYELVADPTLPGTEGLRTELAVFEGFFWRALQDGVGIVYTPNSGRSRRAEPISPANFGFSLVADDGSQRQTVVLGVQRRAVRAAAPPIPEGEGGELSFAVAGAGGRAAAEWTDQPIVQPKTWTLVVRGGRAQGDVTLSWPHLNRQLPRGYRVRLTDPTTGRSALLNTSTSYTVRTGGGERELLVTVLPRSSSSLAVLNFQPGASRGRAITFDVELTGEAEVFLRITSLSGRPIAETAPVSAGGPVRLVWNGLDSAGRRVPRGSYQVVLVARNADGELLRALRTITVR